MVSADKIVRLAACQVKADWITKGIDECVDFGAEPTTRATYGLVLAGFFLAPALC